MPKTPIDRRGLSEEDLRVWRAAAGAADPLPGRRSGAAATAPGEAPPPRRPARRAPPPPSPPSSLPAGTAGGVDARTRQRLRRGQVPIDRRLDLHGMTQREAHGALARALAAAQAAGARCALVVTGKGDISGGTGVLRRAVPRWLGEAPNAARVLDFAEARQRDGGAGALYVLLRRRRS